MREVRADLKLWDPVLRVLECLDRAVPSRAGTAWHPDRKQELEGTPVLGLGRGHHLTAGEPAQRDTQAWPTLGS